MPLLSSISRNRKLAMIAKYLSSAANTLEIGSGDGQLSNQLKRLGHHAVTIDLVPPADIVGDVRDWRQLGLKEHTFDAVIGLEVIEHVDCVTAIRSLCKYGGLIFLSSPHPSWDWVMKVLEAIGLNQRRTSPHINLVDFRTLPFDHVFLSRPAWIHQVGVFRNSLEMRETQLIT
jgi:2-polyprenyl-3-methyl-5-hydroxy-6-metoxy-1,4-benzoquinol methylase